ncbi:hypothetical protein [Vibrio sp. SCSIO 43137]|uniref:hypothetical protein n=1 Tax=Vibrio sp. SCSIO 43137 TaxID=3021011 RepID=UPI0023077796|nr:hypothetical protein [Vibrio sp. SCSIO 43137]WCE30335.1 hypothetical protein PK654_03345 [Vibrio sp. SCSIO 43137]
MNQFKLRISATLGGIIFAIIATLISIGFLSFQSESIALNKTVLMEKNATVEADLTEKFNSYRSVLSGIDVTQKDMTPEGLSVAATA